MVMGRSKGERKFHHATHCSPSKHEHSKKSNEEEIWFSPLVLRGDCSEQQMCISQQPQKNPGLQLHSITLAELLSCDLEIKISIGQSQGMEGVWEII